MNDLRELEWRKGVSDTYEVNWNSLVERHNDELGHAYRAGIVAALQIPSSDEYHDLHYGSNCLWGEGVRCRAVSNGVREFIKMRIKRFLPDVKE